MAAEQTGVQIRLDGVNQMKMIPCYACCCTVTSLYTDKTNCWGCDVGGQLLCLDCDCTGFKPSKEEGKICTITEGHLTCIKPLTCVQITSQIFCLSSNAALPCTEEVPCIVNVLGMNCAYKKKPIFGCCSNIETLEQKLEAKTAGGASPVLEMTR